MRGIPASLVAVGSLVPLSVLLTSAALAAEPSTDSPSRVFYGYANAEPPNWQRKPRTSVLLTFCARKSPPAKGSLVTAVPASPALPALVVRVNGSKKIHGDSCVFVVSAEPVTAPAWRDVGWEKGGAWSFPLLLFIEGDHPKARPLKPDTLSSATLPTDTESKYVLIAADIDGDETVDAIMRASCGDGKVDCQDLECKEIWSRAANHWQRVEQKCGD
jgi:hypothetical protein